MDAAPLKAALEESGLISDRFPNLIASYAASEQAITEARNFLDGHLSPDGEEADVVAFGSIARREMTGESDFDYLVITYQIGKISSEQKLLDKTRELRGLLSTGQSNETKKLRKPGSTGMFGSIIAAQELYQNIGLEADTNTSHTRRMLLLEESVSLGRPALHRKLLEVTVDRYLSDAKVGCGVVPRFLLNDIVRYWRTLAVDYQAKAVDKGRYSVRYLKLIISRKLVFVASIAPIFLCSSLDQEQVGDFLCDEYEQPSVIRFLKLAQALNGYSDALICINECMTVAEEFNGLLGDADWRQKVDGAALAGESDSLPEYVEMKEKSRALQESLERLFSIEPLHDFKNKYLIF